MKRTRSAPRVFLGGALVGYVVLAQSASGQDGVGEPTGLRAVLDYSIGLDIDSNYRLRDESPGTYSALVNAMEFALLSNTRNETFELRFGTELRFANDPGNNDDGHVEWTDPNFLVFYSRSSANSRLTLSSNFVVRDVDTLEPFFIDLNGDAIVDQAGFEDSTESLTEFGARATLETGLNSRVGTTYTVGYQSRIYSDNDDPGLNDRTEFLLSTFTRLQFSPITTGTISLSASQYEYSSGRDLVGEDYQATIGLIQDFSSTLTGEFSIGIAKTHEERQVGGVTVNDVDRGLVGSAELAQALTNGEIYGAYSRESVEDTFRNTLSFGRSLALPRSNLDAYLGVSGLDNGNPAPIFGIAYAHDLPDGLLTASFNQTVTLNTDEDERTLTTAIIGYSRIINEGSSFRLGMDYSLVSGVGDDDSFDDETWTTFFATYQRVLTEDWAMNVGYRGRMRDDDSGDAVSNAVFVNLGRQFTLR